MTSRMYGCIWGAHLLYDEPKPPMWNDGEDKYATGAKWRKKKSKIESKSDKKKRRKKGRR